MTTKIEEVKLFFEAPERYLGRRAVDITIRRETAQEFTRGRHFSRILDIGCGNGSISLPMLAKTSRLTLLDISSSMLAIARSKISSKLIGNVEMVNDSFMSAHLEPQSYDLVLCVGVLAHVECPADVIGKIARLVKPGGVVILEFTDGYQLLGRASFLYHYARPTPYEYNRLSRQQVVAMCGDNGLRPSAFYRYAFPLPGMHRILRQDSLYRITRMLFGPPNRSRNHWLGNEFIYRFERR